MSLNNVHEPRNAEFTAFLGSFLPGDNQMTIILKITHLYHLQILQQFFQSVKISIVLCLPIRGRGVESVFTYYFYAEKINIAVVIIALKIISYNGIM